MELTVEQLKILRTGLHKYQENLEKRHLFNDKKQEEFWKLEDILAEEINKKISES